MYQQPGLNVGHLNTKGLRGKLPEIKLLLLETSLDILAITETKLPSNVSDEEIGINGYFVARKDRDSNGGGVLSYYKQTLTAYEETKLKVPSEMEAIWINVNSQSQTWLVACVYRPPDKHSFYGLFNETLEKVWLTKKNLLVMGDLNSGMLFKGKAEEEKYLGRRLRNILTTYSLKNVIKEPTRIAENTQTLIDLIITSHPENINVTGVSHLGISNHSLVYVNLRTRRERNKLITKTINNYKNFNSEQFRSDIKCAPWSVCEVFNDTDDQVWAWQHLYQNTKQQHISTRKVRSGEHKLPWINKSIRKEQNKRYKLLKEYKTHKDKDIWKRYKNSRNTVKKMIRHAEIRYWKEQFEQAGNDKQFWKIVRKAQGKDKKRQIPPIDDGSGKYL